MMYITNEVFFRFLAVRKHEAQARVSRNPRAGASCSRALRAALLAACVLVKTGQAQQSFPKAIRLVFERNCVGCHNHAFVDKIDMSGGLALDSYERALNRKHPVIVPGNASASELVRRLESSDPQIRMPKGGERLAAEAIETVRKWI